MILALRATGRSLRETVYLLHRGVVALEQIAGALEVAMATLIEWAEEERMASEGLGERSEPDVRPDGAGPR